MTSSTSINTPTVFRSVMASGGAPPPPRPHSNKGNLPAEKVVLPSADDDEEEEEEGEGNTIVVAEEAPGSLTPQASKGKSRRKRASTAVVSGAMPDWMGTLRVVGAFGSQRSHREPDDHSPRVSQAATTQAASPARVRPPLITGAVRRPSSWTSPNEDLAEMLEDVEAGANPGACYGPW
ncbi:MAG: hypothetical protein FRX48_08824 [Lasallia pustulata]|uniref:Uncharacterized protein n=1 Tax=Lasallia pustulata TaxID=136370 RepID=A0A5M8PE52_9LECA|nr:MAG: hypothetical protein FRX48_08824 [Lasallia pustulata]